MSGEDNICDSISQSLCFEGVIELLGETLQILFADENFDQQKHKHSNLIPSLVQI